MGYLGLDQTEIKEDNLFQRLFWPSDHAGEADTLGQQGFWVCFIVAVLSFFVLLAHGNWILAPIVLAVFGLGGMGVREHSQPAAIFVAIVYLLEVVASLLSGRPPGAIQIIATLLLFANIRGTWIAAKHASQGELMPERMNSTFADKLVDQMPARIWPKARIPFFCLAALYAVLSVLGVVMLSLFTPAQIRALHPAPQQKSLTLQTTPTR